MVMKTVKINTEAFDHMLNKIKVLIWLLYIINLLTFKLFESQISNYLESKANKMIDDFLLNEDWISGSK